MPWPEALGKQAHPAQFLTEIDFISGLQRVHFGSGNSPRQLSSWQALGGPGRLARDCVLPVHASGMTRTGGSPAGQGDTPPLLTFYFPNISCGKKHGSQMHLPPREEVRTGHGWEVFLTRLSFKTQFVPRATAEALNGSWRKSDHAY